MQEGTGDFAVGISPSSGADEVPDLWSTQIQEAPVRKLTMPKRKRSKKRIAGIVALCLVIVLAVVGGYIYYKLETIVSDFQSGAKRALILSALPQLNIKPTNPLPGLSSSQTYLVVGLDNEGGNSDTIMVVRINPKNHTASILSLPRDLYVNIPGYGMNKINAAYPYGGPGLLIKTIRDFIGVPINHYMQIDFSGFSSLVNDLGGVYLPVDQRYYHVSAPDPANNWSSINLLPGYQKLDGTHALQWVRFRHLDTDFFRTSRQQVFLSAVFQQIKAQITDLTQTYAILHDLARATASDISSVPELLKIGDTLRQISPDHITRVTMQANSFTSGGIDYEGVDVTQKRAAVDAWAYPGQILGGQTLTTHTAQRELSTPTAQALTSDGGQGRSLISRLTGLRRCVPTALPPGFSWGTPDPARSYSLAGHPTIAAWATAGSGNSLLWMWTTWGAPPILNAPSQTVIRNGQSYQLYYDSGSLREVAWHIGPTRAWITNTLQNSLSDQEMLSLATSCQPI